MIHWDKRKLLEKPSDVEKLSDVSPENSEKEFSANCFLALVFGIYGKTQSMIIKEDQNISDLRRLLFRRLPLPSDAS